MSQSSLRTRGIAAGIAAIAASALAAGVMAAPAQAHDKGNGTSDASHSKDHNTLDAVGIGLHALGRLNRKVYPT